jgi:hypothetical protein
MNWCRGHTVSASPTRGVGWLREIPGALLVSVYTADTSYVALCNWKKELQEIRPVWTLDCPRNAGLEATTMTSWPTTGCRGQQVAERPS